jgi:HlyD family secretion protein
MPKKIFPKEIIEQTTEAHFAKFNSNSRRIYIIAILVVVAAFASLPLINIPITQQSRGVLRTLGENNKLFANVYAQIEYINIKENSTVNIGDTLVILNTEKLDKELKSNQAFVNRNQAFIEDISAAFLGKENQIQTNLYLKDYTEHKHRRKEIEDKIKQLKKDFLIHEKLYKREVITESEFDKKKYAYDNAKQALELYEQQKRYEWQSKKDKLLEENLKRKAQIEQIAKEKENYILKAPISGYINNYTGVKKGNFVSPGQVLANITPKGKLLVECYINPTDIGYISKGMDVVFQFDAYNYNQWGLGHGKVIEISHDVFQENQSVFFKIKCSLNKESLTLKNGYEGNLKKGMTLTGRFYLTERTLLELLYDKLDDWLNPRLQASIND